MDPLSIGVGAAAGFVGSKLMGGKKSTSRKKSTGSKTRKSSTTKKRTTSTRSAGINQRTGRLKKGYKYGKGGRVVKAKG